MNKFSTPTKKDFLSVLNKFNVILGNKLALLTKKNFKQLFNELIYDKRFVITISIAFLSIFAHLSTPAFYQDKWVLNKVKKQLENEFDLNFVLSDEIEYSIFPVPSFHLKNIRILDNGNEFGKIDDMVLYLTFSKFLNKEKINIQDIYIQNSKFKIYDQDIKNLADFFKKKINNKKLIIKNSKVFFKNDDDEVYLILDLHETSSNYNEEISRNLLEIKGKVLNNLLTINLSNDPVNSDVDFELKLNEIKKKFLANINYSKKTIEGLISLTQNSNIFQTEIKFNENNLVFNSLEKSNDSFLYKGDITLKPFFANFKINLKEIDFFKFFNNESFFYNVISSNLINNPNINYKLELFSKNIKNHKLLKNLLICMSFEQNKLNFNKSNIIFDNNINIEVNNSEFVNTEKENYFFGEIVINIKDSSKLYKFFQTNKMYRKKINKIDLALKYDFRNKDLFIERLNFDEKTSDKIQNVVNSFNKNNVDRFGRIEIRNFFNELVSQL